MPKREKSDFWDVFSFFPNCVIRKGTKSQKDKIMSKTLENKSCSSSYSETLLECVLKVW